MGTKDKKPNVQVVLLSDCNIKTRSRAVMANDSSFLLLGFLVPAVRADTSIVELCVVHMETVYIGFLWHLRSNDIFEVEHTTTMVAIKVNMWTYVAVITHAVVVDGNHLSRMLFVEHAERVVNSRATQRRNLFA